MLCGMSGSCRLPGLLTVDLYKDKNAYWYESDFKKLPRLAHRNYLGQIQNYHVRY